jgi:hypothetical protein
MLREASEAPPAKKRSPRWRLLLIACFIELVMLLITGTSMMASFFSHSAADPNSASNNPLAVIGIVFHFPSFITTAPFGLFFLAPILQVFFMWAVMLLASRWWRSMGHWQMDAQSRQA